MHFYKKYDKINKTCIVIITFEKLGEIIMIVYSNTKANFQRDIIIV